MAISALLKEDGANLLLEASGDLLLEISLGEPVTLDNAKLMGMELVTITLDQDDDYSFTLIRPTAICLEGQGDFGGGTLSLQAGNDGRHFFEFSSPLSLTSDGVESVTPDNLGFVYYNIHLTGSTNPSLTVKVSAFTRR